MSRARFALPLLLVTAIACDRIKSIGDVSDPAAPGAATSTAAGDSAAAAPLDTATILAAFADSVALTPRVGPALHRAILPGCLPAGARLDTLRFGSADVAERTGGAPSALYSFELFADSVRGFLHEGAGESFGPWPFNDLAANATGDTLTFWFATVSRELFHARAVLGCDRLQLEIAGGPRPIALSYPGDGNVAVVVTLEREQRRP